VKVSHKRDPTSPPFTKLLDPTHAIELSLAPTNDNNTHYHAPPNVDPSHIYQAPPVVAEPYDELELVPKQNDDDDRYVSLSLNMRDDARPINNEAISVADDEMIPL
jgi:hypothetical protein